MGGKLWSAEEIACLGTAPDRDVASRLGRCPKSTAVKRRTMGIAPFSGVGLSLSEVADYAKGNRSRVVDDYKILLVKTNFIAKCVFVGDVLTQGVVQSARSTTIYRNGP